MTRSSDFPVYSHRVALSVTGTAVAQHLIGIAADSVPPSARKMPDSGRHVGIQSLSGSLSQITKKAADPKEK